MSKKDVIKKITPRRVFDSRGNPTIEVDILTNNEIVGRAIAPSGASTGGKEALELRDNDDMFDGLDIKKSINIINNQVSPLLIGLSCLEQEEFDNVIKNFDNTDNKSNIGSNTSIALSLANYLCAAKYKETSLFRYIAKKQKLKIPNPEIQVFGGGAHAENLPTFQDFLIYSPNKIPILDFFEKTHRIMNQLKIDLQEKNLLKGYSDEGGFWPHKIYHEEICILIEDAANKCKFEMGKDIAISIDVAASEFFLDNSYRLYNKEHSADQIISILKDLNQNHYVNLIEDPFDENDIDSFIKLKNNKEIDLKIIGDDLICTNLKLLKKAHKKKAIDGIIVKPNQCGTITETINVINYCKENNIETILSARSGDTEENYLSQLAVGWDIDMIKVGSFSRSERTSKWNELLRIQELIQ